MNRYESKTVHNWNISTLQNDGIMDFSTMFHVDLPFFFTSHKSEWHISFGVKLFESKYSETIC